MSYLQGARSARKTSQRQEIPGREQEMVRNAAGGMAFVLSPLEALRRFLVLGVEGGTYYATQAQAIQKNTRVVERALREDPERTIALLVEISEQGRAFKQDQLVFVLAVAAASSDPQTRVRALWVLPRVCRTGSQLFMFASFVSEMRGWGATLRKGVAAWYERADVDELAFQMAKYRERNGFTHKRLIDLSHPKPPTAAHERLYQWAVGGYSKEWPPFVHDHIERLRWAQSRETPQQTVQMLREVNHKVPQEFLRSEHADDPAVWRAMLDQGVPMNALVRNLGRLTSYGVIRPLDPVVAQVAEQLQNEQALQRARVHPLALLNALITYSGGAGTRRTWNPVPSITDALDAGFYKAFAAVEPTNKGLLLAVDVSGSMTKDCVGIAGLTARTGAAAMALVTAAVEPRHHIVAYSNSRVAMDSWGKPNPDFWDPSHPEWFRMVPISISPRMRLQDVVEVMRCTPAGGTDCALPMLYAIREQLEVDCFVTYTDNESWAGNIHASQALMQYRRESGIDARMVVVAMSAVSYSVADPRDAYQLDCCGFDTRTPQIISDFASGIA